MDVIIEEMGTRLKIDTLFTFQKSSKSANQNQVEAPLK